MYPRSWTQHPPNVDDCPFCHNLPSQTIYEKFIFRLYCDVTQRHSCTPWWEASNQSVLVWNGPSNHFFCCAWHIKIAWKSMHPFSTILGENRIHKRKKKKKTVLVICNSVEKFRDHVQASGIKPPDCCDSGQYTPGTVLKTLPSNTKRTKIREFLFDQNPW